MTAERLLGALFRLSLLALLPLKQVPLLDDIWDAVQIGIVLAATGGSALIGTNFAQVLSGGGVAFSPHFTLVTLLVLALVAGVKLQLFKDDAEEARRRRQPIIASGIDVDERENGHFLRLALHNPNPRAAEACFVEVVGWRAPPTNRTDRPAPPTGFRFPRSSWSGGGLAFPIGAAGDTFVDIVFWVPGQGDVFYTAHIASDADRPVRPAHPLNPGLHVANLRIGTEHEGILGSTATVEMELAPENLRGRLVQPV